jgi:beta-galactosidase
MRADRELISADGEDVAMFAVEVQDAQGRVVPITENDIAFRVSGAGKLHGTGNGDPTNHQPDKGSSRKAFSGYCMALVQSSKTSGSITVEATSPGLGSASVTIATKAVELRPQVAVWNREVPVGAGITGVWRPAPGPELTGIMVFLVGNGSSVFTLRQEGNTVTGYVEGGGMTFFGGTDAPIPITEGKVDGDKVSFKAANSSYAGTIKGDKLDLTRTIDLSFLGDLPRPAAPSGERPAIGPPPDGTDPSFDMPDLSGPPRIPLLLQKAKR